MTYTSHYQTNPCFPYNKRTIKRKPPEKKKDSFCDEKKEPSKQKKSFLLSDFSFLQKFLDPVEKLLGRKVGFDDLILVAIIYIIFTEKDDNNYTLLLCLLFILLD